MARAKEALRTAGTLWIEEAPMGHRMGRPGLEPVFARKSPPPLEPA